MSEWLNMFHLSWILNLNHRGSTSSDTKIVDGVNNGKRHQTLLGATGTGKTFTMSNVIKEVGKPTLIIAHTRH